MNIRKITKTVDADTGQVLFEAESSERFYALNDKGLQLFVGKIGIKMYPHIPWPISPGDRQKFMGLLPYLNKSNTLTRQDRPGHPLEAKHVSAILNLSQGRTYRLLKRLRDAGVIRQLDRHYHVNPMYFNAAGRIPQELYTLFADQIGPLQSDVMKDMIKERWT